MTIYKAGFTTTLGTATPVATWNLFDQTISAPEIFLDSTGTDNSVTLAVSGDTLLSAASATYADSDLYGFPQIIWQGIVSTSNGGTATFTVAGLPANTAYTYSHIGHTNNASRSTDVTVDAVTKLVTNAADSASRAAPAVFTGTTSGTGTLDIQMTKAAVGGQFYGYCNGFILDVGEVSGPTTSDIVLNGEATHEVIQTMTGVANTTTGESIFGAGLIAVEDDMQAYVVKAVNGMNITWADDGTFTTDADQTEIIDVAYFAPSTGQWSCLSLTIKDTSIVSGGILRNVLRSPLRNILRNPIK